MKTAQFQVGKTYTTRFACDYDSVLEMTVISRTEKTITAKVDSFGIKKLRVNTKYTPEYETVAPLGNFSMSPVIKAN